MLYVVTSIYFNCCSFIKKSAFTAPSRTFWYVINWLIHFLFIQYSSGLSFWCYDHVIRAINLFLSEVCVIIVCAKTMNLTNSTTSSVWSSLGSGMIIRAWLKAEGEGSSALCKIGHFFKQSKLCSNFLTLNYELEILQQ